MDTDKIRSCVVKEGYLKDIIYFEQLDSTNKYAKENKISSDVLVITSHQKSGIGRFGRVWEAEKDENITITLVKNFNLAIDEAHLVNFYTSYILIMVLKEKFSRYSNDQFFLKWPNDVMLNNKKVAGILTELQNLKSDNKKFLIGIGVNVNQKEFTDFLKIKATSFYKEFLKKTDLEELIIMIIEKFYENLVLINSGEKLLTLWKQNTNIINKKISIRTVEDAKEIKAKVLDIDLDGGIKVEIENGNKYKYFSGEISLIYDT